MVVVVVRSRKEGKERRERPNHVERIGESLSERPGHGTKGEAEGGGNRWWRVTVGGDSQLFGVVPKRERADLECTAGGEGCVRVSGTYHLRVS
jgi:hypothetical protein